MSMHAFN